MNPPPPPTHRLHWSPVEPSWIVSVGLIILAVLPHKLPPVGIAALRHPAGALVFAVLSTYVAWTVPVLGAAMFIFLAGVLLHTKEEREPFAAAILNKDRVQHKKHRWLDEEVLHEDPRGIQEKTENPVLNYDEVMDYEAEPWYGEGVLDEQPHAIQEKPVGSVPEYDEGGASYSRH